MLSGIHDAHITMISIILNDLVISIGSLISEMRLNNLALPVHQVSDPGSFVHKVDLFIECCCEFALAMLLTWFEITFVFNLALMIN